MHTADREVDRGTAYTPIRRCCEAHRDWETLAQHIVDDFPHADLTDIARELRMARHVIELASLREDTLVIAELIARHRLLMCVGEVPDVARLDPQLHPSRAGAATRQPLAGVRAH